MTREIGASRIITDCCHCPLSGRIPSPPLILQKSISSPRYGGGLIITTSASIKAVFCSTTIKQSPRSFRRCASVQDTDMLAVGEKTTAQYNYDNFSEQAIAKIVAFVGDKAQSHLGQATWEEVLQHTAQRLKWVNEAYEMIVINENSLQYDEPNAVCKRIMQTADICIVVNVNKTLPAKWISEHSETVSNVICFESSADIKIRLGGEELALRDPITKIRAALPGSSISVAFNVLSVVEEAWKRKNSEDIRFVLLILIDKFVSPVDSLKSLRATDLNALKCMVKNCSSQILDCLADPNCRKALSCLQKCAPTDQVCSYQCIASYESPKLEAFSLCVLQKHNCLGLNCNIPMQPDVEPLKSFRGQPISHSLSEDIFVGWLGKHDWSWRVAAGQNPAYDYFSCQFQIFYRGRAKGSMWYDPIFQVKTLDNRLVWRRRHYRVRRGSIPGTFFFSVLDNGVVSKEYWRIVDVADDLAWGLFFYSGAAAAVGQSYTGAILATPDGQWPNERELNRVNLALEKCGIKIWEMFTVNNTACEGPPLGIPENAGSQLTTLWG